MGHVWIFTWKKLYGQLWIIESRDFDMSFDQSGIRTDVAFLCPEVTCWPTESTPARPSKKVRWEVDGKGSGWEEHLEHLGVSTILIAIWCIWCHMGHSSISQNFSLWHIVPSTFSEFWFNDTSKPPEEATPWMANEIKTKLSFSLKMWYQNVGRRCSKLYKSVTGSLTNGTNLGLTNGNSWVSMTREKAI